MQNGYDIKWNKKTNVSSLKVEIYSIRNVSFIRIYTYVSKCAQKYMLKTYVKNDCADAVIFSSITTEKRERFCVHAETDKKG